MASRLDESAVRGRWADLVAPIVEPDAFHRCSCGEPIKPKGTQGRPPKWCDECRRKMKNAKMRARYLPSKRREPRSWPCAQCGRRHWRPRSRLCRDCETYRCADCGCEIKPSGPNGRAPNLCPEHRRERKRKNSARWKAAQRAARKAAA